VIKPAGDTYGKLYFLSEEIEKNYGVFEKIWDKIKVMSG
jgi:hypothetical protein